MDNLSKKHEDTDVDSSGIPITEWIESLTRKADGLAMA